MIDALMSGTLYAKPQELTSDSGRPYVLVLVVVALRDGWIYAECMTFEDQARAALLALEEGDTVAIAGELRPRMYQDKHGNTQVLVECAVQSVQSAYHVRSKQHAVHGQTPSFRNAIESDGPFHEA